MRRIIETVNAWRRWLWVPQAGLMLVTAYALWIRSYGAAEVAVLLAILFRLHEDT